jgi:hypothetical protein
VRCLARCDAHLQRENYSNAGEHQDMARGAESPPPPWSCGRRGGRGQSRALMMGG